MSIVAEHPESLPRVSCIMPTANRRAFVPQAIHLFLAQNYSNRELLILDNGTDCIRDLVPDDPRVRYMRETTKKTLGTLRNQLCEEARGDIIMHWDDDDWMSPDRIKCQTTELLNADADIHGLYKLTFFDPLKQEAWRYEYPLTHRPWVAGGTMCYWRDVWKGNKFADTNSGEDTKFIWSLKTQKIVQTVGLWYCALIHNANTSHKRTNSNLYHNCSWQDVVVMLGSDIQWYSFLENKSKKNTSIQKMPLNDSTKLGEIMSSAQAIRGNKPVKLNLGCCDRPLSGYINVDAVEMDGVQKADLTKPWPWDDGSVSHVQATDIIEHLPDKIFTMNEIWRVLIPNGTVEIVVPTTDGSGAFQDPTHVSFWNRRSFLYYESGNPYRERFAKHYGINASFRVKSEKIDSTIDGPKLTIVLVAVK